MVELRGLVIINNATLTGSSKIQAISTVKYRPAYKIIESEHALKVLNKVIIEPNFTDETHKFAQNGAPTDIAFTLKLKTK